MGERFYIHRHSLIHELEPHAKIISMLLFLLIVIITPIQNHFAFIGFFTIVLGLVVLAKLPIIKVLKRSAVEIPFLLFAILMPFVSADKERAKVAALSIIAKATIGVLLAILLSSTTPAREILRGFETLKLPTLLVQITSFVLRYLNVINDEMERMTVARSSRGFEPKGIKDWKFVSAAAGALFIRSYERGERVHLAMISRGYEGKLPSSSTSKVTKADRFKIALLISIILALSILGRFI
ncbi:MAG: cobalt ECF transporter T component CbiQ [Candidatus Nanopelagicaceae bacterium]